MRYDDGSSRDQDQRKAGKCVILLIDKSGQLQTTIEGNLSVWKVQIFTTWHFSGSVINIWNGQYFFRLT